MLKITSHFRVVLFWVPLDPRCRHFSQSKILEALRSLSSRSCRNVCAAGYGQPYRRREAGNISERHGADYQGVTTIPLRIVSSADASSKDISDMALSKSPVYPQMANLATWCDNPGFGFWDTKFSNPAHMAILDVNIHNFLQETR